MLNHDAEEKAHCVCCAWRQHCQKKFSIKGGTYFRCPDYCKDLSIYKKMKHDEEGGKN